MATLSSRSMPMALSCTLAAVTVTAITSPSASEAIPRLRPRDLLPASSPVVAAGTPAAECTVRVSMLVAVGSSARPAASRTWQRSRSWRVWSVPSSRQAAKWQAGLIEEIDIDRIDIDGKPLREGYSGMLLVRGTTARGEGHR